MYKDFDPWLDTFKIEALLADSCKPLTEYCVLLILFFISILFQDECIIRAKMLT